MLRSKTWSEGSLLTKRFKKKERDWSEFSDKCAIQLNDTHPSLAIIELFRILIDEENLRYEEAFLIIYKTFAYTNHTVLPEAYNYKKRLEKWQVELMEHLLPRHLELVYLINHYFLDRVAKKYPNDSQKMSSLSLIEESTPK